MILDKNPLGALNLIKVMKINKLEICCFRLEKKKDIIVLLDFKVLYT